MAHHPQPESLNTNLNTTPKTPADIDSDGICVDASVIGGLFGLTPQDVTRLMRSRAITGICEKGLDADAGTFRLNFFYQNRRARLSIDAEGKISRSSVVDFSDRMQARVSHKAPD